MRRRRRTSESDKDGKNEEGEAEQEKGIMNGKIRKNGKRSESERVYLEGEKSFQVVFLFDEGLLAYGNGEAVFAEKCFVLCCGGVHFKSVYCFPVAK